MAKFLAEGLTFKISSLLNISSELMAGLKMGTCQLLDLFIGVDCCRLLFFSDLSFSGKAMFTLGLFVKYLA